MSNLVELFDNVVEFQNYNGVPLAAGKLYVFALGRTRLMDTWSDIDGESLNPNPIILDDIGQCHCYVSDSFDYTIVVCDQFDNEIFSVDKYLLSKGEHSHADVAVAPSEHIGVSSYHVGEVTVYVPYLTGEVGKVYEGIDPIVVNNNVNRISANHIPLGVQDPLYFVEDSETACIIGCSAQTEIPVELSGKWDEASDTVIANSAQWAEGTEYEAGSYVDIDGHTINVTGLQPEGDYAYNSALSSKLDVTALPQDLVHSGDLTAYYPSDNPSGFITGVDLTDYATTAQLDEKLDKSDSGNFYPMEGNPSGFLTAHQSLQGYATEQWVEDKGYITGIDIQESAGWNEATTVVNNNSTIWNNTTNVVSSNSAQWGASNPQIPVTGINGIKISESADKVVFEVSANYATEDWVTAQGYLTTAYTPDFAYHDSAISAIDESAIYDTSAHARINTLAGRINTLSSDKADVTALSDYQTTAGMTAYQPIGDYVQGSDLSLNSYDKISAISGHEIAVEELPEGVMVESGLEYDNTEISGYSGSAFKDVALTDVVTANSGVWGGSALPISAGSGVIFELVNNTLVASVNSPWIDITTACTLGAYAGNCSVYVNPAARICWLAGAFSPTNTGNFLTVPVEYKWLTRFEAANTFNHYIDFNTNGNGNIASVRDGAGSYWSQTIMWAY